MMPNSNPKLIRQNAYKALVCIFLHGGNDGNSLVAPPEYWLKPNWPDRLNKLPNSYLNPVTINQKSLAFSNSTPQFSEFFSQGKLAVILNMGNMRRPLTPADYVGQSADLPEKLLSHEDQTRQIQLISDKDENFGWLGRLREYFESGCRFCRNNVESRLQLLQEGAFDAVAFSQSGLIVENSHSQSFFPQRKIWFPDMPYMNGLYAGLAAMAEIPYQNQLQKEASRLFHLGINQGRQYNQFLGNSALSPERYDLGAQLDAVKQMVLAGIGMGKIGRQVFYVSMGGFDTHANQEVAGSSHSDLLASLASEMARFYDDLELCGIADQVTQFTLSEFGRTFRVNDSKGTDHGWGNHQIVLGGAVKGGVYGEFPDFRFKAPGSANDVTGDGVWIPTIASSQYGATLAKWFGLPEEHLQALFPTQLTAFAENYDLGFMQP